MPRSSGSKPFHIAMTEEEKELVKGFAQERGFKVTADYIRNLIEQDRARLGKPFKFDVDRGGYRRRKDG